MVNVNTSLHLLLTAELMWITLYAIVLFVGLAYDNLNFLSLTFFFLIFSAVEFGVGLVIMLIQHLLTRSIDLDQSGNLATKFSNQTSNLLLSNRINWKV